MGFMDKAKKMAEQAQEKFDDVQKQFNQRKGPDGEARPEPQPASESSAPPHGDPLAEAEAEASEAPKTPPGEGGGLSGGDPLAR